MVDLGVPCASLLAFPSFLASASGVRNFLTTIVTETFGDISITKAIRKWLSLTNEQKSDLSGTQENSTQTIYVETVQNVNSGKDDKLSKLSTLITFLCRWLNIGPCKKGTRGSGDNTVGETSLSPKRPL